jgi:hypothetical protein
MARANIDQTTPSMVLAGHNPMRRQRDSGALGALTPAKRGPKSAARNPLAAELVQARRENARLGRRLEHAEAIIEIQKNTRGPRSRLWT